MLGVRSDLERVSLNAIPFPFREHVGKCFRIIYIIIFVKIFSRAEWQIFDVLFTEYSNSAI